MSLSFVFIWLFKLGLSGSQLVDREAKKGPSRPDGAGGGEGLSDLPDSPLPPFLSISTSNVNRL